MSANDPIAGIGGSDRKPVMRIMFALMALSLSAGCSKEPTAEAELEGTAVFFNFYDERVEAYVDDELLFAERLDVDDSSTGLSKELVVRLRGCSRFKVVTESHQAEREICPQQTGFGLWVSPQSPSGPIMVDFEQVFTPALD